jgi:hypothetical protein
LVGTFWEKDAAKELDRYLLIVFVLIFLLIQIGLGVWLFFAYDQIRKLKRQESHFKRNYKHSQQESDKNNVNMPIRI